jgi:glyoxylase-like metal-dependent hydrolase (beta-lactamase superfamily II)
MKILRIVSICVIVSLFVVIEQTWAGGQPQLRKITKNIYAVVGELGNRTAKNFGNNATFGFVVTDKGVVLIDSGGTHQGAVVILQVIKSVTNKPVVKVINTGGQDHRWLGNSFFKKRGAAIIASNSAVKDQKSRVNDQLFRLANLVGEKFVNATTPTYAEITFESSYNFKLGNTKFEIYHKGQAHTPGDSFVWLPQQKVMFTGDIVYTERMLGIGEQSNSKSWLKVYQAMSFYNPKYLIPGHGSPTSLDKANTDTYGYLTFLRKSVSEFMEKGGDISDISKIDQSKYKYLLNYKSLSGRNAQKVYAELEWE